MEIADQKLLFDSGPGTMHQLLKAGVTIFDLTHIFYSHFHPDHSAELVPLLFASKYSDGLHRTKPLTLIAGYDFKRFYAKLHDVYGRWIELAPGLLDIIELPNDQASHQRMGSFDLDAAPVAHNPESLAYRIRIDDGTSVVYSGDTDYCESLVNLAKQTDVLICEAAQPDDLKVKGHLTPSMAGRIAAQAAVGRLVLTHFYPSCDHVDIAAQCRTTYNGPLILAQDMLTIKPCQR